MVARILIGADHAGFELKEKLKSFLMEQSWSVIDVGTHEEASCDYPDIAHDLCNRLLNGDAQMGILICGTGLGMSIAANRHAGIRAALCTSEFHARMGRAHNDANVLVFGGRVTGFEAAMYILRVWLETEFEGGRHSRRVQRIETL
ncbi:MAG: ribose 5-phosphate isomerase [Thermodesulfobacteriota bacterium]|nr:ribose 5-phosphate isomerase [Thermodesulfobacteriota bacterium]